MKNKIIQLYLLLTFSSNLFSQENSGFGFYTPDRNVPCLSKEQHQIIEKELKKSRDKLIKKGILKKIASDQRMITLFSWPVEENNGLDDYGVHGISNFVDQNLSYPDQVLDYNCGNRTYDLATGYNHGGTDIYLWPFSWYKMENNLVKIVAAAPGMIIYKSDGNFDHSCSFNNNNWNAVYIQHDDGSVAWYGHMKSGSLTQKYIGQSVARGEYLGIVGSSGSSTGPHLHFEIHDAANKLIDPYQGDCNALNPTSWWMTQRPYYDSGLNALRTHSDPPVFSACPQVEIPNEKRQFCAGELVYFAAYYRDQLPGQSLMYKVYQPNNTIWQQWSQTFSDYYSSSYWYWYFTLPSVPQTGIWKFQVTYLDQTYERFFDVNGITTIEASGSTGLCEGEEVTLQAPVGYYGFNYQWRRNGIDIPDANNSSYVVTQSGSYVCVLSIESGCSTNSNAITVIVYGIPDPALTPDGPISFCDGLSVPLSVSTAFMYLWNTGATTQTILVSTPGIYFVTVTNAGGCTSVSDTTIATINALPVVDLGEDIILEPGQDTVLDATGIGLSYLWSTGATTPTITVNSMGTYSVTVTDSSGCTSSDELQVMESVSSNDPTDVAKIWVFPNPVHEILHIQYEDNSVSFVQLYDYLGRKIDGDISMDSEGRLRNLDVRNIQAGMYYVQIGGAKFRKMFSVIKI